MNQIIYLIGLIVVIMFILSFLGLRLMQGERAAYRGEVSTSSQRTPSLRESFHELAKRASHALGTAAAFAIACGLVVAWVVTGPLFHFSDSWQLVINTGTTIVTFLMVFLIQNTQSRDARALHLKLDELLRSIKAARNRLIDVENCTDEELEELQREFDNLRKTRSRKRATTAYDA